MDACCTARFFSVKIRRGGIRTAALVLWEVVVAWGRRVELIGREDGKTMRCIIVPFRASRTIRISERTGLACTSCGPPMGSEAVTRTRDLLVSDVCEAIGFSRMRLGLQTKIHKAPVLMEVLEEMLVSMEELVRPASSWRF